jgi:hypothetical protein
VVKIRQRTYLIDEGTIQRVDKLADRLHVHKGELVRWILKRALDLVDVGEWRVPTAPAWQNIIIDEGRKP